MPLIALSSFCAWAGCWITMPSVIQHPAQAQKLLNAIKGMGSFCAWAGCWITEGMVIQHPAQAQKLPMPLIALSSFCAWAGCWITEGMVIQHPAQAQKLLNAIKGMGVRLAIDDFGTGYSSLGQLKNFPIDTLKVDRSFIRDIATDPGDRAITEAIIAMGKTLSLTVVAEGVETAEQEAFLREHACDE